MIKPQAISLTSSPTILIFLHPTQVMLASGGGGVLGQTEHAHFRAFALALLWLEWSSPWSHDPDWLIFFSNYVSLHLVLCFSQKSSLTTFMK